MLSSRSTRWLETRWRAGASDSGVLAPEERWVVLEGTSMRPTLRAGDRLMIEPIRPDGPLVMGEVVVAATDGRLVAHRVEALNGREVVMRGDARAAADPPIPREAVLGRVVAVSRAPFRERITAGVRRIFRTVVGWS
jgi:signal peptidase I